MANEYDSYTTADFLTPCAVTLSLLSHYTAINVLNKEQNLTGHAVITDKILSSAQSGLFSRTYPCWSVLFLLYHSYLRLAYKSQVLETSLYKNLNYLNKATRFFFFFLFLPSVDTLSAMTCIQSFGSRDCQGNTGKCVHTSANYFECE